MLHEARLLIEYLDLVLIASFINWEVWRLNENSKISVRRQRSGFITFFLTWIFKKTFFFPIDLTQTSTSIYFRKIRMMNWFQWKSMSLFFFTGHMMTLCFHSLEDTKDFWKINNYHQKLVVLILMVLHP